VCARQRPNLPMWVMAELVIGRPIRALGTRAHQTRKAHNSMELTAYYIAVQQQIRGQLLILRTRTRTHCRRAVREELVALLLLVHRQISGSNELDLSLRE
jgi:hypothetical protein